MWIEGIMNFIEGVQFAKMRGFKVCGFLNIGKPNAPRYYCDIERLIEKFKGSPAWHSLNHENWLWQPEYQILCSRRGPTAQIKFYYSHPNTGKN